MTKNTIQLTVLLSTLIIFMLSCLKDGTGNQKNRLLPKISSPSDQNTISLSSAIKEAAYWRNYFGEISDDKSLKAFPIPVAGIRNLAAFQEAAGVRACLCLKIPGNISSAHIIPVPVDNNGKDTYEFENSGGDLQNSIYDLTQPCPSLCDDSTNALGKDGN